MVVAVAILTWVFSDPDDPHYVLLRMFATATFLCIEAHRFREYDAWWTRLRTLQRTVFHGLFAPEPTVDGDREEEMREVLEDSSSTVSFRHAFAHRLRRVHVGLGALLVVSWIARVTVYRPDRSIAEAASLPGVSGTLVFAGVSGSFGGSSAASSSRSSTREGC